MAQYIYRNNDEVDLDELNSLVDKNLDSYLSRFSNRQKEKWLNRYNEIRNRGIKGFRDGQLWISGDSFPEDKYTGDVAHFYQTQFNKLTSRKDREKAELKKLELEEAERKAKLITFDNKAMSNSFNKQIANLYGLQEGYSDLWHNLDKPVNGIRTTTNRLPKFIELLENWNIDPEKYNFEGTAYKDYDDFNNRRLNAINLLRQEGLNDKSREALNHLGLNPETYLSTGENDTVTLTDGTTMTRSEYNKLQEELKLAQLKSNYELKLALLRQLQADRYTNATFFGSKMYGKNPEELSKYPNLIELLNTYTSKSKLSGDELSEIVGTFKLAAKNNLLKNLSKEELQRFGGLSRFLNLNPNRLKKIDGLNGFYWDTLTNSVVRPYNLSDVPTTNLLDIVNLNSSQALSEKQKKQAEINMNTAFKDIGELSESMKKELYATGLDIASIVNPEAFSGSAMALYASHLRDEANPNRGFFEKWLDRGTAALGGIQVAGDLMLTGKAGYNMYKLGKLINGSTKVAGAIGTVFAAAGVPDAASSLKKLATEPRSITPKDVLNIAYGFMAAFGVKAFTSARNKQTIAKSSNPTITEHNISIKDKNGESHNLKIDSDTAKDIQRIRTAGKKKAEVDSEILNIPKIKESIKKYNESNPTKKLETEGASVVNNSKNILGRSGKNKIVESKQVRDPNASQYEPVGTNYYVLPWQRKVWSQPELLSSNVRFMERLRNFWNPLPKPKNNEQTSRNLSENSSEINIPAGSSDERKSWTVIEAGPSKWHMSETQKDYRNILTKHSGNNLSEEPFTVEGFSFKADRFPNSNEGFFDINYGSKHKTINFKNQEDLRKQVLLFLKENKIKTSSISGTSKTDMEKMGNVLRALKARGVFKQGGTIDKQRIQRYKEYIRK